MRVVLAHILLQPPDFLCENETLFFRTQQYGQEHRQGYNEATAARSFSGTLDFLTYLNALPLAKWRRYAALDTVGLHVELAGSDCDIALVRAYADGSLHTEPLANMYATESAEDGPAKQPPSSLDQASGGASKAKVLKLDACWQGIDTIISLDDAVLVGLALISAGISEVRNAYFYAEVDESQVRPVRIALATTTFHNEDYILPNIERLRSQILDKSDYAETFHLYVIDNGNTLECAALQSKNVSVLPNKNTGGAGGFARGMLEALKGDGQAFTHVLLTDDDIRILPESLVRTRSLLQLAQGEYKDACVQGAMLKMQEPSIHYEDVAFVRGGGGYAPYKPVMDVSHVEEIVRNETISVEGQKSYGAWWYSCIPICSIQEHGLPLPFFIRIDDVEFGLRTDRKYMCMSGVCVWHAQFTGRFRASVDSYQYVRNFLIAMACTDIANARIFMLKYWRNLHGYLRIMNYNAAELWLDALEDYLRGPSWLEKVDGAQLMKDNAAKNEPLVPLEELDAAVLADTVIHPEWLGNDEAPRPALLKALESVPHDRHYLPDALLIDKPAMVDYERAQSPWRETARRKTLVALDAQGKQGHIRSLDRVRYKKIMKRYRTLKRDYNKRNAEVVAAYKQAAPVFKSVAFWERYLGISQNEHDNT